MTEMSSSMSKKVDGLAKVGLISSKLDKHNDVDVKNIDDNQKKS